LKEKKKTDPPFFFLFLFLQSLKIWVQTAEDLLDWDTFAAQRLVQRRENEMLQRRRNLLKAPLPEGQFIR
jgi:hypothetical protein